MVFRTTLRASTCALVLALAMGCDQNSDEPAPNPRAESPAAAPTDSGPKTNSGSKTTPAAKEAAPSPVPAVVEATGPACLPGTWHYDFSDKSLETMMSNVEGAKVTKKEGELLCDISVADGGGAMKCSVKEGKPFIVEVAATQPGLPPMVINFEATGSTTSKFRLLTDKQIQISEPGLGDLSMKTTVTLAGKPISLPMKDLLQAFSGETGTTSSYECKGNDLKLRPEIEGTVTGWQILKRVP